MNDSVESLAQCLAHSRRLANTSSFSLLTYSVRMGQWWRRRKVGSTDKGRTQPRLGGGHCRPGQGAELSPGGGRQGRTLNSEAQQKTM